MTIAWDKNDEPEVVGYKVHYGTTSGNYQYSVDVGDHTSCSISGLNEGTTYYFAATAYDSNNNESTYSEELSHSMPIPPPPTVDTDGDGIFNNDEINIYGTNPNQIDTDGDGINDGKELDYWGNNWNLDYDSDGVINLLDADSDGDGVTDGLELSDGYDPADPVDNNNSNARVTEGLQALYSFDEGSGNTIHDVSRVGTPLDLTVSSGTVGWVSGGLAVTSPALIKSAGAANKLTEACQATNEISIEAWVKPANTSQNGPARIVTFSKDPSNRNFTLGQDGDKFDVRLRSTATDRNGRPSLSTPAGLLTMGLTHVVYTRNAAGRAAIYINGIQVSSKTVGGDLSSWNKTYELALANELSGNRPWLGELYLVAVYNRALSEAEVEQNFFAEEQ